MTVDAQKLAQNQRPEFAQTGRGRRCFWTRACWVSLLLLETGCQKQNIRVDGKTLPTLLRNVPVGIPVDIAGALEAIRSHFQTRGVVSLSVNMEQISNSSALELINTTTKASLIKAPAGTFGLASSGDVEGAEAAWPLTENGFELNLTIYPLDPHFVGKFAYGVNDLVLNVDEQAVKKDAKQSLTMQDFPYFYHPHAFFSTNAQQVDGFEGELLTITGPYIASDGFEISSSPVGVLNR